jgi:hypothetical protein
MFAAPEGVPHAVNVQPSILDPRPLAVGYLRLSRGRGPRADRGKALACSRHDLGEGGRNDAGARRRMPRARRSALQTRNLTGSREPGGPRVADSSPAAGLVGRERSRGSDSFEFLMTRQVLTRRPILVFRDVPSLKACAALKNRRRDSVGHS